LAKCKGIDNPADFATTTKEKGITCATSTKAIRAAFDPLTKEERAGVNKSKAVKAARNKLANDGVVLEVVDNDDNVVMEVAILSVIENIDESIMKAVQEESLRLHI
jgi:hypothetical protein